MPTQYDMNINDDLFRGILEFDYQPYRQEPNPYYDPNCDFWDTKGVARDKLPWRANISVPDGPTIPKEICTGPYRTTKPIKTWVTRNRGRYKNLRVKRIEKVTSWEEAVDETEGI